MKARALQAPNSQKDGGTPLPPFDKSFDKSFECLHL